ncbi:energy transducer TonB [Mucilaginibacter ginsenosidivorans]|uniref:TonB family protein n=1 Tax=Mucilaginibacter ginsenosidivorans TaxID=398053 RepID=A0A5B8V1I7_9SPHI|nr:energy transducer TonB [Mucilaginibacter ginsenosidivorans]QEC64663.1 TonB family protein [Mucilaginibacter ginsenosidivorans]
MIKILPLSLLLSSVLWFNAGAQQNDNSLPHTYYFKKGLPVAEKNSAEFVRVISMPTDSANKGLYIVTDYYPNGKLMMTGMPATTNYNLKRQGEFVSYYPNGNIQTVKRYSKDTLKGVQTYNYPNGKLYHSDFYNIERKRYEIAELRDSTGKVLTSNGNGTAVLYDQKFKLMTDEGPIVNGVREGEWRGSVNDSVTYVCLYKDNKGTTGKSFERSGVVHEFTQAEIEPTYEGGLDKFYNYLVHNIHYPKAAKKNGVAGRVFLSFIIEKDGSLSNIKVLRGIGSGCDEEAVRALQLSPKWSPGYQYGMSVRVQYALPVGFTLKE